MTKVLRRSETDGCEEEKICEKGDGTYSNQDGQGHNFGSRIDGAVHLHREEMIGSSGQLEASHHRGWEN